MLKPFNLLSLSDLVKLVDLVNLILIDLVKFNHNNELSGGQ